MEFVMTSMLRNSGHAALPNADTPEILAKRLHLQFMGVRKSQGLTRRYMILAVQS
jgi:hypothetical protein